MKYPIENKKLKLSVTLMKRAIYVFLFISMSFNLIAQERFQTEILNENIKTLQIKVNDDPFALPILQLNWHDVLHISFDEMSHETHSYSYEVYHCNADWTKSDLSSSEYIRGFTRGYIDDYAQSINTTVLYTNYLFHLPNDDVQFTISGNYIVSIYEDGKQESPIAYVAFSVVEPSVDIDVTLRGNTDIEINQRMQQIDFNVLLKNYSIQDPQTEIKVLVRQNERLDNQVFGIQPNYFSSESLSYKNNPKLIFEGGNEYNRFDFSSIYNYDERIDRIKFERPNYHVYLNDFSYLNKKIYQQDFDANGRFVVNYQDSNFDVDLEADYMFVHFYLPVEAEYLNKNIYIGGFWNYNLLNDNSKMHYDSLEKIYYKTLLLKQGGYNYQYWLSSDGKNTSIAPAEVSHWQTQNRYAIYVYHRPWGGRYDKLIGVKIVE